MSQLVMNRRAASLESCRRYPRDLPRPHATVAAVEGHKQTFAAQRIGPQFDHLVVGAVRVPDAVLQLRALSKMLADDFVHAIG